MATQDANVQYTPQVKLKASTQTRFETDLSNTRVYPKVSGLIR